MPYSTTAKNTMLDAMTADRVRLHSGAPGASGTDNELGAGLSAASFAAAGSGQRLLSSDVAVTGLAPSEGVTHYTVWTNAGTVFLGSQPVTGDAAANVSGEYTLKATTTYLTITDS